MFVALDQQSSLQLRHLSHSMPLSVQKAFIQIDMHLHVSLLMPLLKGVAFVICSVVANSLSFFLEICHILKSKHALPVTHVLPTMPQIETIAHVGEGPLGIVAGTNTVTLYLGLEGEKATIVGNAFCSLSHEVSSHNCFRKLQV